MGLLYKIIDMIVFDVLLLFNYILNGIIWIYDGLIVVVFLGLYLF